MRAGIAVGVALVAVLASGGTRADGNQLLENCQEAMKAINKQNVVNRLGVGQCFGMTEGVRNTITILNTALPSDYRICFPKDGITNGQAVRIVTKFLQDNPAQLNQDETYLTMMAYKTAYGCK